MFFKKKDQPQFTDELGAPGAGSFLASRFGDRAARAISVVLELVQIAVFALALVILIRSFVVQPFSVRGASMEPTYLNREYLVIDEVSYRFREPARGEVIVFRYPADPREYFIKRIIGLPGETVVIVAGYVRIINNEYSLGVVLEEPYISREPTLGSYRVTLGANEYYLLGDNRTASLDSRVFGPVSRKAIVGRAWLRGLPPSRAGIIETPEYSL